MSTWRQKWNRTKLLQLWDTVSKQLKGFKFRQKKRYTSPKYELIAALRPHLLLWKNVHCYSRESGSVPDPEAICDQRVEAELAPSNCGSSGCVVTFILWNSVNDDVTTISRNRISLLWDYCGSSVRYCYEKSYLAFVVCEAHCTALQAIIFLSSETRYRSCKDTCISLYVTLCSRDKIGLDESI
jgi:hypothetical protein